VKEQELLFLGFLQDGPKHGYQLKKLTRDISVTFTGLIKTDSIYYPLQKMLKNGLVTQVSGKEGNRPLKYTYKITQKGKDEFKKLLLSNILTIEKPYFSIDLSLYFLHHIPIQPKRHYLQIRIKLLNRLKKSIQNLRASQSLPSASPRGEPSPNLSAIFEHNQELLDAEIKFITRLAEKI